MSFTFKQASAACAFATLAMIGVDAAAATIKVTCEARGTSRSKISIDGKDLAPGTYTTVAVSGSNMAISKPEATIGDEIETDYDSRPADIRAGVRPRSRPPSSSAAASPARSSTRPATRWSRTPWPAACAVSRQ